MRNSFIVIIFHHHSVQPTRASNSHHESYVYNTYTLPTHLRLSFSLFLVLIEMFPGTKLTLDLYTHIYTLFPFLVIRAGWDLIEGPKFFGFLFSGLSREEEGRGGA
jgi:hypothetical protein